MEGAVAVDPAIAAARFGGSFPGRFSSWLRLFSSCLPLSRFFCRLLQRFPLGFLFFCSPLFLFLCRFLAFSLLCHGWSPSRVMKQRTRPLEARAIQPPRRAPEN